MSLKVGDKLYRYTGVSIMGYEVYGVVKRKVGTMYEVRSLSCRDHDACCLLLIDTKKDGYKFVDMITEEEQDYWHKDYDAYQRYCTTKSEAMKNRNLWTIDYLKEAISKATKSIEKNNDEVKRLEAINESLEEES